MLDSCNVCTCSQHEIMKTSTDMFVPTHDLGSTYIFRVCSDAMYVGVVVCVLVCVAFQFACESVLTFNWRVRGMHDMSFVCIINEMSYENNGTPSVCFMD